MSGVKIKRKGLMFVLSSPSGAGKTTISRMLLERDNNLKMSVSMTTREKRKNEVEGRDYYFVDKETFVQKIEKSEFLECAEVFGHHYGTPESIVKSNIDNGVDVLFDIDWQGTEQLAKQCRQDMISVFILPPSMKELESRLRNRAMDSDEVIEKRMSKASDEISHWYSYDYVIINDSLEESLEKVYSILVAERHKRTRMQGLERYIKELIEL